MESPNRRALSGALTVLLLASSILVAGEAAGPRPMTVEDLWKMQRVGSPALSPDGKWVAFTVTAWSMEDNKANTDLWLVPADGGEPPRRLTWNEKTDTRPRWSPDGKHLMFVSKRGEGPSQLYRLPMAGGEAEPLTDLPVAPASAQWFPDGKRIAFAARTWPDLNDDFEAVKKRLDERKEETQVRIADTRRVRYWDHYLTDGRFTHLFELDLETREVRDLTPGSERLLPWWTRENLFDLSPDGKEIAFAANKTEPPYRTVDFDVWLMPAKGGEAKNITSDNPAADTSPRYSPDGRFLVYGRNRRPDVSPDFTRMARYDRRSGKRTGLADAWDGQPAGWTFTPGGDTVLFHAQERGRVHVFAVPVEGGEVQTLVEGGTTGGVEAGPGGRIVYGVQSITSPTELMTTRIGTGASQPLTAFNDALLAELDLGTVEDVTFEGAGGDPVQMFLLLPPGFEKNGTWPLLHTVHGGPHGAWTDSFHYRWNVALFGAPGYVVAAVNFHGSTGFGQAFAESILGAHGDKPFTDIMKATDYLVEQRYVDPERMAAAGGSYGGYLVSWILGHTDRFAALINHAGVYDLMGQFASDWTWSRPNNYGAAPWEDPERIDRWSPARYAKNFATPTLIVHGEKDYRVPYTHALNLHQVLTGKGVRSRLVIFPDENHWILKPQSARIWWGEVHGWLDEYLGAAD